MKRSLVIIFCLATVVLADDKKDDRPPIAVVKLDRSEPVSFENEVRPLLAKKCAVCHSGSVVKNRFDMGTMEGLIRGGKSGAAIVAGKSAESRLVLQAGRTQAPFMPPPGEDDLTPQELALLKLWIDQGARGMTIAAPRADVKLRPLPARVKAVRALAFSPDKSTLAVPRGAGIVLIDVKSGQAIRTLGPLAGMVDSLTYSPDGKMLTAGGFRELVLFDPDTGAIRRRDAHFADRVVALAYSPDGKWLAAGGGSATIGGELKLIEADTGKVAFESPSAHSDTIFGVSFRPDGTLLATAGADKFVRVWAVPSGERVKSFEGHAHHVLDVGWKPDGRLLASAGADDVIKVWDYERGEAVRTIRGHTKQVTRLVFIGKSGNFVTGSGDATARLWNIDGGNQIRAFPGGQDFLYAIAASADGSLVAVGGEEGTVRIYSIDGKLLRTLGP
jgi:WD40 repeat protein